MRYVLLNIFYRYLKHGLSVGKTSSSDLRSPFSEPNLICTATKIMDNLFTYFSSQVQDLIHYSYQFCDNSMNSNKTTGKKIYFEKTAYAHFYTVKRVKKIFLKKKTKMVYNYFSNVPPLCLFKITVFGYVVQFFQLIK